MPRLDLNQGGRATGSLFWRVKATRLPPLNPSLFPPIATIALVFACLLSGCGENKPALPPVPDKSITISANDDMKYDTDRIEAKPGQKLIVTLKNVGTAPKFSMGHNFIVLNKGTDLMKFVAAGSEFASAGYIAPALKGNVIAFTQLLGPGESETISFRAPTLPGEYDFVCTFPGHAPVGMKGKLVVEQ